MSKIINPNQKPISRAQKRVAELQQELMRVMGLHMRLISWCAENLPEDQLPVIQAAMRQESSEKDLGEFARMLGIEGIKPH